MAQIRMPVDGEDFFQFVKGVPAENLEASFFPTYAHLITSAAALGYSQEVPIPPPRFREKDPRPIDIEVFRNQSLYDTLLLLALARSGSTNVSSEVEKLCGVIEELACAGFREMKRIHDQSGSLLWPESWEDTVLGVAETGLNSDVGDDHTEAVG